MFFMHPLHFNFIALRLLNCALFSSVFFTYLINMARTRQILSKSFFY